MTARSGDVGSGIGQGIGRLHASIALSQALSRGDCRVVGDIAHVDEGVKRARATRPWLTGGAETRAGSIEVDYQTELQHLVLSVFIQVRGVVRIGLI